MSEKKLTPKEAFDLLVKLNPAINLIEKAGGDCILASENGTSCQSRFYSPNVDWGGATSYKPEKWRTATIEDVKRALDEPIECRSQGCRAGRIVGGYLSSTGVLIFNVRMSSDVIDLFRNVEVRE